MDTVTVPGKLQKQERLPLMIIRADTASQISYDAIPAEEGYFALTVPCNHNWFQVGVLFGMNYRWVQIESAELLLNLPTEKPHSINIWQYLVFDQMKDKGGKLFECLSQSSLMLLTPPPKINVENYILKIVFRPVVKKDKSSEMK